MAPQGKYKAQFLLTRLFNLTNT